MFRINVLALIMGTLFLVAGYPNMADAADTEKLTLEVFDKTGKSVEVVKDVSATRVEKKDGSIGFVLKTNTLAGNRINPGDKLTDTRGVVWVVKRASTAGQGEIWSVSCEKKP